MSDLDLETRLRADAARREADDFVLLDLDEALDLATHDDKHERSRRSALRWAAVAAAVVVVAGVAAALSWKSPKHANQPTQPPTVVYRGHVYSRGPAAVDAAFVDSRDPAKLDVLVRMFLDSAHYQCDRVRPSVVVSGESGTAVTLQAQIYRIPPQPSQPCLAAPPTFQHFVLKLTKPVGSRNIVNAADRSTVPLLDPADLPTPAYLPAGFRPTGVERVSPTGQLLTAGRLYERGQALLTVLVGPPSDLNSSATAPELVTEVAGVRAEVHVDENGRCLTWPTRPGIARQVCSSSGTSAADGSAPLPAAELLKVARSLR